MKAARDTEDNCPWAVDEDEAGGGARQGLRRADKAHAAHAAVHGAMRRDALEAPLRGSPLGNAGQPNSPLGPVAAVYDTHSDQSVGPLDCDQAVRTET